jgi:hypothetical protein
LGHWQFLAGWSHRRLRSRRKISCESINYQYRRCPVPNLKRAELISQVGNQPCQEGRSWGYDNGGVWVNNGCRALFQIKYKDNSGGGGGYYPPGYGETVRCESFNYQPNRCPVNTQGGVRLDRILGGQCSQGRSWGYDRNGIWVNNGCRAQFIVGAGSGGGGGGYPPPGYGQEVRCESFNYQPQRCAANTQGGVRLSRVIAGNCAEGRSWGWDRGGIWVNNGCRAVFVTGQGGGGGGVYPPPGGGGGGYPPPGGGQTIKCESWNYKRTACNVRVPNGVRIEKGLGGTCALGDSFGWAPTFIWVDKGCRAVFRVY